MTMLDSHDSVSVRDEVATWHEVEKGFWVGNTYGRFLGTVESTPSGYVTRDEAGGIVGTYSVVAEARAAIG